MSLTPKEISSRAPDEVYPASIAHCALIESGTLTIPGAVATNCTIALGFKPTGTPTVPLVDQTGHYLLTIQKRGTAVRVWKQGVELTAYTGTVGATYGDFLANVLTHYAGSNKGIYSRVAVVEQALDYTSFWECSDFVTGLWVPKVLDIPTAPVLPATSYSNPGGSGNRTGVITATSTFPFKAGSIAKMIDGATTNDTWGEGTVAGTRCTFEFATPSLITQAQMTKSHADPSVTFKWQGSNDGSNWVDISTPFTIPYAATITLGDLTGNDTYYTYYSLLGVSGTWNRNPYMYEFNFKITTDQPTATKTYGPGGGLYEFDNAASLGSDTSGNGNDATVTGVQTLDTPTNNYCTLNALDKGSPLLSEGSLKATGSASASYVRGTTIIPEGKYYFEVELTGRAGATCGISNATDAATREGATTGSIVYRGDSNLVYENGVTTGTGPGEAQTGDVIGHAVDTEARTLQLYKNGVALGSAYAFTTGMDKVCPHLGLDNASACVLTSNFGATGFAHTPPAGFLPLCSANLPDPVVMQSAKAAQIILRQGTGTAVGILTPGMDGGPDFVNGKNRTGARGWFATDTLRGAGKTISTNSSGAEIQTEGVTAFTSTGYSLPSSVYLNEAGYSFRDLCLKAGVEHGFQMKKYTGDGIAGRQIAHNLGKPPTFILIKDLSTDNNWRVYHVALGAGSSLSVNLTSAKNDWSGWWNNTAPTSTHFTVGSHADNNGSGKDYIAYIFTDSDVFKAFSYVGNASADGPFVNLGGKPLAVPFWKNSNGVVAWYDVDAVRNPKNTISQELLPSSPAAETASNTCEFSSNGLKIINDFMGVNGSGNLHIGLAILKSTKYSNAF